MLNKKLLIQIIAVLIMQALFITQVDFSLAAVYKGQESLQESALRVKKIQDTFTSLVIGIGNGVDYKLAITRIIKTVELSIFNKDVYKVLSLSELVYNAGLSLTGGVEYIVNAGQRIRIAQNVQKQGPPQKHDMRFVKIKNRTEVV